MSTLLMEQLLSVIKEYREEKLSQEEALKSLEEKCKSAINENRQKMETIVSRISSFNFQHEFRFWHTKFHFRPVKFHFGHIILFQFVVLV